MPRQFTRERLGERYYAALAGRIDGLARRTDAASIGGDVDHAARAVLDHAGQHGMMHVERPIQIDVDDLVPKRPVGIRSEEHTSELQSLMRISYAVFCLN